MYGCLHPNIYCDVKILFIQSYNRFLCQLSTYRIKYHENNFLFGDESSKNQLRSKNIISCHSNRLWKNSQYLAVCSSLNWLIARGYCLYLLLSSLSNFKIRENAFQNLKTKPANKNWCENDSMGTTLSIHLIQLSILTLWMAAKSQPIRVLSVDNAKHTLTIWLHFVARRFF